MLAAPRGKSVQHGGWRYPALLISEGSKYTDEGEECVYMRKAKQCQGFSE